MELTKKLDLIKFSKIALLILLGSLLLTISAKVKIPFYPVPMTMQTFVVLFLGLAFGHKIDEIINKVKNAGMEIYDISTDEGNLEDVFIDLTKS